MAEDLKPKEDVKIDESGYNPDGEEKKVFDQFTLRKNELLSSRESINGVNIDEQMRLWDTRYFRRETDVIDNSDLDINVDPVAVNRAFRKIQSALSIIFARNPRLMLENDQEKYSANRELIKSLAMQSWKKSGSLYQYRLSMFNAAKRGWYAGKTFHRDLEHTARFPKGMDEKGNIAYHTAMVKKMDEVAYMNLDNHNVWFDEEARPYDHLSIRDAMHREVWHIDKVRAVFPKKEFPNMEFVKEGGDTTEVRTSTTAQSATVTPTDTAREKKTGMTELFFYEHQYDDWFIVDIHGVMVVHEPLPQNHKRLSYTTAGWALRNAETIYMIGVVEMLEKSEDLVDYILNASLHQLVMTINPPGFYAGTEDFEDEVLKLKPGKLRRTLNPNDVNWLQIPAMKREALDMIDRIEADQDADTGISKPIEGDTGIGEGSGDTAFEFGIAREAGLKRLRLPIENFKPSLEWEFANRIDLIRQIYSVNKVRHIANEDDIMNYIEEVNADPQFYFIKNEGEVGKEEFFTKEFREVKLNLEQDDNGNFVETDSENFFKIMPEMLPWEGDITVDVGAMLISDELERADTLRMSNLLLPIFQNIPPEIAMKPTKQILRSFNKDPRMWMPQSWLDFEKEQSAEGGEKPPVEVPENVRPLVGDRTNTADTIVPPQELETPIAGRGNRLSSLLGKIKRK